MLQSHPGHASGHRFEPCGRPVAFTRAVINKADRGQFVVRGLALGRYRINAWAANGTKAKLAAEAGTAGVRIELKQE